MTPEEQERLVGDLETALDRLQALYNQFFMGIEKLEPTVQRKEVERKFQLLRKEKLANTALRFRLQTQIQKFNTQSTYWRRITRQIEEGTYQRDVMRARKRSGHQEDADLAERALATLDDPLDRPTPVAHLRDSGGFDLDDPFATEDPDKTPVPRLGTGIHKLHEKLIADARAASEDDGDELAAFFQRRSIPPPPPAGPKAAGTPAGQKAGQARPAAGARKPEARPPAGPGPGEERLKAIYRSYLAARKKTGESTDGISFEKVSTLLQRQLAAKDGVKDFKVVIRGGKAVIKTVKDG
jgi:hypothetical protein